MLKAEQNHYFLAGIGEDARIFLSEADCPIDSPVQGFEFLDDAQIHLMFETGYSQEVCRPIRHILTAEEKAEKDAEEEALYLARKAAREAAEKEAPSTPEQDLEDAWEDVEQSKKASVDAAERILPPEEPQVKEKRPAKKSNPSDGDYAIYTDGSYRFGKYSWAFAVYKDGKKVHSDFGVGQDVDAQKMRNVAGEVAAAMAAVRWAEASGIEEYHLFYDYSGVGNWVTKKWKAKNSFTQRYASWMREHLSEQATLCKVEGHTGIKGNEEADKLAKYAFQN